MSSTSAKKREKMNNDINTELQIGKEGMQKRDLKLLDFNNNKIKLWNPGIQNNG